MAEDDSAVHFEIYQDGNADGGSSRGNLTGSAWRWRLRGPNGETMTSGEAYGDHAECLSAVYMVRRTSSHTPIRDV
jgi:uncharacterized protein YegP (UPF0339 family)